MMKKLTIGLLCGGNSVEHEISLISAKSILAHLDSDKYDVVLIGLDKRGRLIEQHDAAAFLSQSNDPLKIRLQAGDDQSMLIPDKRSPVQLVTSGLAPAHAKKIDVIFPVIHGNTGEDGAIQGLLKLLDVPYVGTDILGCAITMDKAIAKQLLKGAGLPIPQFISLRREDAKNIARESLIAAIGFPCFVKPANSGSSVGINKVTRIELLNAAMEEAFLYDDKIIIEEGIDGRELECAVLGNAYPQASVVGEIITDHDFYSYAAKYTENASLRLDIPAKDITEQEVKQIQTYAVQAFTLLSCAGMARVDFFMDKQRTIFINEVNTIPGFTSVSMYPMLWEASGIPYPMLIDKLIALAIEKHRKSQALKTSAVNAN